MGPVAGEAAFEVALEALGELADVLLGVGGGGAGAVLAATASPRDAELRGRAR